MPRHDKAELGQPLLQVSRPASVELRSSSGTVEATGTYSGDLSTVNYVDVEFELNGGDPEHGLEPTDTIQPFVRAVCDVSTRTLHARECPQKCLCSWSTVLAHRPVRKSK